MKGQAPAGYHSWSEGPLWRRPWTTLASVSSSVIWWSLYPLPQIIIRTRDKAHKAVLNKEEVIHNQEWYVLCLTYYDYLFIGLSTLDPYVISCGKKLPLGFFTYFRGKTSLRHLQSYLVHLLVDISDTLKAHRTRTLASCRSHGLCQASGAWLQGQDWGSRERWWVVPSSRLFVPLVELFQLQRTCDLQGTSHQWQRRAVYIKWWGHVIVMSDPSARDALSAPF